MQYAIANIPRERRKGQQQRNVAENIEKQKTHKWKGRKGKQQDIQIREEWMSGSRSECRPVVDIFARTQSPRRPKGGHRTSRQCWQGVDNKHTVRTGHLQDGRPQERMKILDMLFGVSWVSLIGHSVDVGVCLCVFSQRYPRLSTQIPALYLKTGMWLYYEPDTQ